MVNEVPAEEYSPTPQKTVPKQTVTDSGKPKTTLKIPTLDSLRKGGDLKKDTPNGSPQGEIKVDQPFTSDQLKIVWQEFAEKRKVYQAEYHVLTQEIEVRENLVVVHLHNPIQETLLATLKSDLLTFLREKLNNSSIQLTGELKTHDEKKVLYTNRDKFDHLVEKNPALRDLKERLGLDTDF